MRLESKITDIMGPDLVLKSKYNRAYHEIANNFKTIKQHLDESTKDLKAIASTFGDGGIEKK